ncbi:hypothetical protein Pcinc_013779 [Petrolisthes cinctipes]|uniref:Potassium channel domain-containing protein n=1 Tax=Petrolisthes cinctipes TaxID=88211 RepID=A0AAE1FZ50_PETCI|nr:hypothetical protein Pcinc_013779 [Petrolisthes cinctipes]
MKGKSSLFLCLGYALYLILGGVMFMYLEFDEVDDIQVHEPPEWRRLKEMALTMEPHDPDEVLSLATWLPKACGAVSTRTLAMFTTSVSEWSTSQRSKIAAVEEVEAACPHLHRKNMTTIIQYHWRFIDALYFSMTVTTTIGYGFHYPTRPLGRIMCILYSLIGIPLTGILLAWTSEFFGELLFKLFKSKIDKEKQYSRLMIVLATIVYILMGFVVFIFLPSVVFMLLEDWSYLDSVYYAYITLTTIGFGDLVSGKPYEGASLYVYHIAVIIWIMVGLGYWVMVASFITKALKSKRIHHSFIRSAEEMRKLMHQLGIKENPNHNPKFLRENSKATFNLMLQLSNMITVSGDLGNTGTDSPDDNTTATTSTGPSSPSSPIGIPGLSTLFGPGLSRVAPLDHMMGSLHTEASRSSPGIKDMSDHIRKSPQSTTTTSFITKRTGEDPSGLPTQTP